MEEIFENRLQICAQFNCISFVRRVNREMKIILQPHAHTAANENSDTHQQQKAENHSNRITVPSNTFTKFNQQWKK